MLAPATASRFARIALDNVVREYPNKLDHAMSGPGDVASPRALHPAFYGSYDWHSSVHMHWLLARLLRCFPSLPEAPAITAMLDRHLSPEAIAGEVAYLARPGTRSFERTYGWAWLLKLVEELHTFDDPLARELEGNLRPLTDLVVQRHLEFLPKLLYPIRVGEHGNTAFALCFAWDYASATGNGELRALIEQRAKDYFLRDEACPLGWEPGGFDFLSPCLEEADLMRRVLPKKEFAVWLKAFLPRLSDKKFSLAPGEVSDRADGKLVHLDGLNFSRAWCLYGIAGEIDGYGHLRAVADLHMRHSLDAITAGSYEGEHWLASFAIYALSRAPESHE